MLFHPRLGSRLVSQIPTLFVVPLPMFIACGNKSKEEEEHQAHTPRNLRLFIWITSFKIVSKTRVLPLVVMESIDKSARL
jgi:hypothetical protein